VAVSGEGKVRQGQEASPVQASDRIDGVKAPSPGPAMEDLSCGFRWSFSVW